MSVFLLLNSNSLMFLLPGLLLKKLLYLPTPHLAFLEQFSQHYLRCWVLGLSLQKVCRVKQLSTFQFSSVTQSCPTLYNPMDCSMSGFPVHHQLPELTQTHVHWVNDAIQPFHPLSSPSPPAFSLSMWVISSHQVAKILEFQLHFSNTVGCSSAFRLAYLILSVCVN